MRRRGTAIALLIVALAIVTLWVVNARRDEQPALVTSDESRETSQLLSPKSDGEPDGEPAGNPVDGSTEASARGEERASGLPRLVDLGADKCVPCKMMAPILDEMKETYAGQLTVDFIDVWKDPAPGREYGVKVIPTQIFLDERGNELFRHQGFMSREDILAKWREFGYEFTGQDAQVGRRRTDLE